MSDKTYDKLKYIAFYFFPALTALWGGLVNIWEIPNGDKITLTIGLIGAFIAGLLKYSTASYNAKLAELAELAGDDSND